MTVEFDCRVCGIGDALVSLWIAEGAREAGHDVVYLPGRHDRLIEAFSGTLGTSEGSSRIEFGGESASYRHELKNVGSVPHRGLLWQHELPFRVDPRRPKAQAWEECDEWARDLKQSRTGGNKPLAILFPACAYNTRTWPVQKWTRLGWALEKNGVGTVGLNSSLDSIDQLPFYAYGYGIEALISLIRIADVVIANDSGPAHLAGTLGVKTLAIMGPTDPETVFGYCPDVVPVRVDKEVLPCVGCHFKSDRGFCAACDQGCEALQILPVQTVLESVMQHLQPSEQMS